ncbi:hypothetical protein FS842_005212 [Serendipita sp. 407]|nr:hypothetical protein FS842_005212 [Serendipita sp. 407]
MAMDFRKINIDQYDEDKLLEEELYEPDPRDPETVLAEAKQKAAGVRGFISKGDIVGALSSILENAPYGPKVDDAKVMKYRCITFWFIIFTKSARLSRCNHSS